MKTFLIVLSLVAATFVAGTIIHLNMKQSPLASAEDSEAPAVPPFTRPVRMDFPREELLEPVLQTPDESAQASIPVQAESETVPDGTASAAPPPTPFSRAIEILVSPESSFQEKQVAWNQLRDAGQLDQAIEALRQGGTENPTSADYPAALGQAQLHKAGELAWKGGPISELGILGMQADQSFDAALALDPANWEAQFFKAAAMHHWPLELNKGDEVIQRLSDLIDQQEAMPSQPQFGQTYVLLGDQYQKMGQPEHAAATWLIGAKKFPGHLELQERIRSHSGQFGN